MSHDLPENVLSLNVSGAKNYKVVSQCVNLSSETLFEVPKSHIFA